MRSESMLYHGSANLTEETEFLLPAWGERVIPNGDNGEPEQQMGNFVFAEESFTTACAYALKVHHPHEREAIGSGRTRSYCFSLQVFALPFPEESRVVTIITRAAEFLQLLQSATPRVITIPCETGSYRFERVYRKGGMPTSEFVCRTKIPLACCNVTVLNFRACLEKVQVLFLDRVMSKREWITEYSEVQDRRGFLASMIRRGVLVHANREYGIAPFDFAFPHC